MMIHALHYEPQGQEQRFEPQGYQPCEQQDRHIHLHLHLHLSFRSHQGHFSSLNVTSLPHIFAALLIASVITFVLGFFCEGGTGTSAATLFSAIPSTIMQAGLVLAWVAMALGGIPVILSAWHRSPRARFLLALPLLSFLFLLILAFWNPLSSRAWGTLLLLLRLSPLDPAFSFIVLVCAYLFFFTMWLNRAFGRAEIADTWLRFASRLSFVVVSAMVLMMVGGFSWLISLMLGASISYFLFGLLPFFLGICLLPLFIGMCLAVLIAIHALFSRPRRWN